MQLHVCSLSVTGTLIAGCAGSSSFPNVDLSESRSGAESAAHVLGGKLHGGQQPIVGAKIYLLAAGTTGYGSAATSLLTSASYPGYATVQDANGFYYTTTDASGSFQIVDGCRPGQQIYVASVGGNPGGGLNSAATEIAILGQCPAAGNFDSTLTGVFINEVSTVAAAYAVQAYAVDAFDIGGPSSTTAQQTGIANAFANAANLFDVQNVSGLARTATLGGNGTVPQSKIHTLANILAACVNSTGPSSGACSTLLGAAKTNGTSGTTPTDVTTAAMNIARNPWANVGTLFGVPTSTTPFSPQLANQPNDFTLTLNFPNAALGTNPSLAVDGSGNVWTLVPGQNVVTKLSPLGKVLSGTGYTIGGGFANGRGLAFDTSNNLWVLGMGSNSSTNWATLAQLNSTGVYQGIVNESTSNAYTHPPTNSTNLAIDGTGYFYYSSGRMQGGVASTTCCTVRYTVSSGAFNSQDVGNANPGTNFVAVNTTTRWATGNTSSITQMNAYGSSVVSGGGLNNAVGVALDHSGNAWVVNSGNNSLSEFNSSGTAITGTSGYTGAGLATPQSAAICGLGNIWVSNNSGNTGLSQFSSAGLPIGNGYHSPYLNNAGALVVDSSGDIWVASTSSAALVEFVGVAAPVVTPLAAAVSGGSIGVRP